MATHDYIVDNQNGANFRSDLNNALAAIVSNNSSATAPTTTYAFMLWADTAAGILKQRNAADSAWINILTMATGAPLGTIAGALITGNVLGLEINTTATSNLGLGTGAVDAITTGDYNVGVGDSALTACTTGQRNVALGDSALLNNTTGIRNVALGMNVLNPNISGDYNVGVGYNSLRFTTSSYNTAIGAESLLSNTTGYNNVAMGYHAADGVTTGTHNVCIGYESGSYSQTITTGSDNTIIGAYAHPADSASSNCIVIGYNVGGSNSTLTFGSGATDTRCSHGSTTWSTPSDERYKKDITDATAGLGFVNELRPVTYNWKNEGDLPTTHSSYVEGSTTPFNSPETQHGFIAQEVKAVIDSHTDIKDGFDMWAEDSDGRQRLGETALIPMLVKAIQELSAKVEALENA